MTRFKFTFLQGKTTTKKRHMWNIGVFSKTLDISQQRTMISERQETKEGESSDCLSSPPGERVSKPWHEDWGTSGISIDSLCWGDGSGNLEISKWSEFIGQSIKEERLTHRTLEMCRGLPLNINRELLAHVCEANTQVWERSTWNC